MIAIAAAGLHFLANSKNKSIIAGMEDEIIDEPEYTQFRGKWKEAIAYLIEQQKGIAVGALHHPKIGEIDLVWGVYKKNNRNSSGFGLSKIVAKHPEVLQNMQHILLRMEAKYLNEVHGWQLKGFGYKGNIRLIHNNNSRRWLMTLFEKQKPR